MTTDTITTSVNVPTDGQPPVVPLPSGALACMTCGVAVPAPHEVVRVPTGIVEFVPILGDVQNRHRRERVVEMTRCGVCTLNRERAADLLAEHPKVRASIGSHDVALYRLQSALNGLEALSTFTRVADLTHHTDRAVRILIDSMLTAGAGIAWSARLEAGTCASSRWSHLTEENRAALRDGLGAMMRARTEATAAFQVRHFAPPAEVALRGCLLCGVGVVEAMQNARDQVWTTETISPRSVGGSPSGQHITGVVCPPCAHAIEYTGSVGQTAMERAVLAFLGQPQQQLSATELIGLRAWAVVSPSTPSLKPWDHMDLQRVRDELGI